MVTINCIPTFGTISDPLFDGISMDGVDLAHQALAIKNEIQKLIANAAIELFNAIAAGVMDFIYNFPIPGTPFTVGDVLTADYATLKEKIKNFDLSQIPFFQALQGVISAAISETEAIIACMMGGIMTFVEELSKKFEEVKDAINAAIALFYGDPNTIATQQGILAAAWVAFLQWVEDTFGFSWPIEIPTWEEIKAQIVEEGEEAVLNVKQIYEHTLEGGLAILGEIGDWLGLPDPLFEGISFSALDVPYVVSYVQNELAMFVQNIIAEFIATIIEPFKEVIEVILGDIADTITLFTTLLEFATATVEEIIDLIRGIRFCNEGEDWITV